MGEARRRRRAATQIKIRALTPEQRIQLEAEVAAHEAMWSEREQKIEQILRSDEVAQMESGSRRLIRVDRTMPVLVKRIPGSLTSTTR